MLRKALFVASKRNSRKNLYEFLRAELTQIEENSRILNIGSGGEIEVLVDEICALKHMTVSSLDISPDRSPDIVGDVCEMSFEEEFDAVVMAEVLEHVTRPHVACQKVCSAIRSGGRLIMTTPFIFPLHERPHDYWRFTRYGLEYLLRNSGFATVTVKERNGWGESITVLLGRTINTPGHSRLAQYAGGAMALLFLPVGKLLSLVWPHDFLTTGYTVSAIKAGTESPR